MIYRISEDYFVRAFRQSDLSGPYPSWFEDQEVCKYNSHGKFFRTQDYFRSFYESLNGNDQMVWAICHDKDGHIGNVSLQGISLINRNAEFAVLIGDRRHWHKGVGKLAGAQLISHGFDKLNLERVYCGTAATNEGMQSLALALGFREEGRRRAHLYLEGAWVDVIEYGILRSDYRQKQIS
jgi:ribosomal-protein-alanine N-acetyltransferase